jgi:hypothetical protein
MVEKYEKIVHKILQFISVSTTKVGMLEQEFFFEARAIICLGYRIPGTRIRRLAGD